MTYPLKMRLLVPPITRLLCLGFLFPILHFGTTDLLWPSGTLIVVTSTLPTIPNTTVAYFDKYAIDGDTASFWNDNTPHSFPDNLTITFPHALTLGGISLISRYEGWPTDYQIQTLMSDNSWKRAVENSNVSSVISITHFSPSISCFAIQISINNGSAADNFSCSRISEVMLIFPGANQSEIPDSAVNGRNSTSTSGPLSASGARPQSTPPSKNHHTAAIIGGIAGIIPASLLITVVAFKSRWRKLRGQPSLWERCKQMSIKLASTEASSMSERNTVDFLKPELEDNPVPVHRVELDAMHTARSQRDGVIFL